MIKFIKNKLDIQELHVISWLLKDMFWCLKLNMLATIMVIPTAFLTIYLLIKEKDKRLLNLTLFSWVFMNITWMLHEIYDTPEWPIRVFMLLGIAMTIRFVAKRLRDEGNIFRP
jgi:hypothetical protein